MASTNASLRVVKSFHFKGGTRLWSNRYHFNGGTPADATHWTTLSDAVVAAEKAIYQSIITITETIGYAAGSEVPIFSKVYSVAGTFGGSGGTSPAPGEVVFITRYSTAARSTKNHPIYAFNYYHGAGHYTSVGNYDLLDTAQKAAAETYAGLWVSGFSDGSITAVRATPAGHAATGHITDEYVSHRDFPYTRSV
jgi:hypothetical protein